MTRRTLIAVPALLALFLAIAGAVCAEDSQEKHQELQRIKKEMQEKKQKLQRADKRERSILTELEKIDREIQAGSAQLADQRRKLREAEAALAEIEQSNTATTQELARLKQLYAARLRALYKMSRTGGYALAVLSSDSFTSAYRRVRYLGIIAERDKRMIGEYGAALERLASREREVRDRAGEILARREAVEKKRVSLESQRRKKGEILGSVKQEKTVYEATLKDLEESSSNLWAMIRLAERDKKAARKKAPVHDTVPASADRNRFPWPVKGPVLTRFGSQRHPQFGTAIFRRGIDIEARTGDEVRAVHDGQVVFADWYKGYGRLVIIDHGEGLYTLYGHLSQLGVGGGDRVTRGQVVGLAGDTGSLKGSKLYFEVRRNGEAEDPLLWLAKR
ncbi:MAG: peptidoglycan DD-metalloendopeptidase family protein [Nitrospirae bacterium]|nr:peptidoglycan DD-metalloendopeptidase family protein [Nitrospirota bacterium]NTW66648.1 peptidoglycan DD-metalloendopeptidase family protein [Nitrospirota bacterium]